MLQLTIWLNPKPLAALLGMNLGAYSATSAGTERSLCRRRAYAGAPTGAER